MKKLLPFLLALCCLMFCACASKPKEKAPIPEAKALVSELLASGAFSEDLAVAEDDVGRFLYALEALNAPGLTAIWRSPSCPAQTRRTLRLPIRNVGTGCKT